MNKADLIPLLMVNNSIEFRFIFPIAPFGVIAAFIIMLILNLVNIVNMDYMNNLYVIYGLSLAIGLFISEILYFYKKDELFFYEDKVEKLKGGKINNVIRYKEIKEVIYSHDFTIGGGPGGVLVSYLKLDLGNGKFEKLPFVGILQKKNIKKALKTFRAFGVNCREMDSTVGTNIKN